MSYSLSVKFKTEAEVQSMLNFLKIPKAELILNEILIVNKRFEDEPISIVLSQGNVNSPYIPKGDEHLRIYNNSSINASYWCKVQLFVWMAIKSSARDKEGQPMVWIDDKKIKLVDISNGEKIDSSMTKIKDGQFYKEFPKDFLSLIINTLNSERKKYEKTRALLVSLDNLYMNYINGVTANDNETSQKKKMKKNK